LSGGYNLHLPSHQNQGFVIVTSLRSGVVRGVQLFTPTFNQIGNSKNCEPMIKSMQLMENFNKVYFSIFMRINYFILSNNDKFLLWSNFKQGQAIYSYIFSPLCEFWSLTLASCIMYLGSS